MSLTGHLRTKSSPVRHFLREGFPHTREAWKLQPPLPTEADTILPKGDVPYSIIGTAIDYRLRYYFRITPAAQFTAAYGVPELRGGRVLLQSPLPDGSTWATFPDGLADSFLDAADDLAYRLQPERRRLDRAEEDLLLRYCVVLALFDRVYRSGVYPDSPLIQRQPRTLADMAAIADESWIDDLRALSWAFYDRFSHMLSLPAILNPEFEGSRDVNGADADLIVDGCLIDIKTTIRRERTSNWLWQLIGYLLLDYNDQYHIESLGVYFSRQTTLYRWPLKLFLDTVIGTTAWSLPDLRSEFREVAQTCRVRVGWSDATEGRLPRRGQAPHGPRPSQPR